MIFDFSLTFALAIGKRPDACRDKIKFFEKSFQKIWSVLEKGVIFAPLSPLDRGDAKKEIIEKNI